MNTGDNVKENKLVQLQIDEDLVQTVLAKKIEEAVGVALIDRERVVAQLIDKCLTMRVDSDGKPCT